MFPKTEMPYSSIDLGPVPMHSLNYVSECTCSERVPERQPQLIYSEAAKPYSQKTCFSILAHSNSPSSEIAPKYCQFIPQILWPQAMTIEAYTRESSKRSLAPIPVKTHTVIKNVPGLLCFFNVPSSRISGLAVLAHTLSRTMFRWKYKALIS